ncbi:unnamed protein product [Gordionus sp. m RMFG-2023]
MKINNLDSLAIFIPKVNKWKGLFARHNYPLRLAGGPVRDILLGVISMTEERYLCHTRSDKMILVNKNGKRYGAITFMINDNKL